MPGEKTMSNDKTTVRVPEHQVSNLEKMGYKVVADKSSQPANKSKESKKS